MCCCKKNKDRSVVQHLVHYALHCTTYSAFVVAVQVMLWILEVQLLMCKFAVQFAVSHAVVSSWLLYLLSRFLGTPTALFLWLLYLPWYKTFFLSSFSSFFFFFFCLIVFCLSLFLLFFLFFLSCCLVVLFLVFLLLHIFVWHHSDRLKGHKSLRVLYDSVFNNV